MNLRTWLLCTSALVGTSITGLGQTPAAATPAPAPAKPAAPAAPGTPPAPAPAKPAAPAAPVIPAAPAIPGNLVINGDFTKFDSRDNLWDGVDSAGMINGWQSRTYALSEGKADDNFQMPVSVSMVDINGDGLLDLMTCDPAGIIHAYINSGTKTEPKFTFGELVPLFPPRIAKDTGWHDGYWTDPLSIPKMALYDWNKRGTMDLIFGNYAGDIVLVPNTGTAQSPAWAQPATYAKVKVNIAAKRPWGNMFSPCPIDWNKDGKTDLLVGEGSYSANAVFVLLNQSSSNEPKFSDDQRFYLCYGDGKEQLVPTVADYNGDGLPDVLVGDRLGTVSVYLNTGTWKPGAELPLSTVIKFGATEKVGAPGAFPGIAPFAVDYNGDGLFDLLIGKTNGRVSVAINKGTKEQPKFDAPVDIKGEDVLIPKMNSPKTWESDPGFNRGNLDPGTYRGNIGAYVSVIATEASPGGGRVLRAGYSVPPNKVFKLNSVAVDGKDRDDDYFRYWREEWEPVRAYWAGYRSPSDYFIIRQQLGSLKVGTTYSLKFKARGVGIDEGRSTVALLGAAENVATKFKRGERGSVKADKNEAHEEILERDNFTGSKDWKNYEKTFKVGFKDKDVKKITDTTLAILEFKFMLPQFSGTCDICDVQLVPVTTK